MALSLVIVESPAKVKKIQGYLGSKYIVKASFGHCFQIDPKGTSIDKEKNFEPKYVPAAKKSQVISEIRAAAKKCDTVYIASDPDREGEAIGYHLAKFVIKNDAKIKRVTFHEITKSAILKAFQNATVLNEPMYHSQQARAVIDRLVGYEVSPVLWSKVCKGTSAGRVQSIGLKIIVERQKEIDAFIPKEYWDISAVFRTQEDKDFKTSYFKSGKIKTEEEAKAILSDIKKERDWSVSSLDRTTKTRHPSPLFNTASMQQFAATNFGWPGKKTMKVAQELYELGRLTYHRTDSVNISKEAMNEVRQFIPLAYGAQYLPKTPNYYRSKNKSAQEAHEGIRPTSVQDTPSKIKVLLTRDQGKLYEAVFCKFVSSQMMDAKFDSVKAVIESGDKKHKFRASGQSIIFEGFLKAWPYGSAKENILPSMKQGEPSSLIKTAADQHFTSPPAAYNDASLVKTMEENGVGRPSTYASIIDTLEKRAYVERDGKNFKPTELGTLVCDYLIGAFPEMMDTGYTARVEEKLDEIAEGKHVWYDTVGDFYTELSKRIGSAKKGASAKQQEGTGITCPTCGKHELIRRRSRYGEFYGCAGFQEKGKDKCKAAFKIGPDGEPVAKKEVEYMQGVKCDKCGKKIAIRTSRKTGEKFGGCSGFPKCKRMFDMTGVPIEPKKGSFRRKRK